MTHGLLSDAALILPPMRWLIALWMILTSAQWLVSAPIFAPDGIIPWSLLATQRRRAALAPFRRRMSVPRLRVILCGQLIAAIALAVSDRPAIGIACLTFLIASQAVLIVLSGDFWAVGATKMGMIAMVGALLLTLGVRAGDPGLVLAGLLVAGGQLVLCYSIAGFSKLAIATWRDGTALQDTMTSDPWGHRHASRLIENRRFAIVASWGVILAEALFPLALLAPTPWLLAALGVMLAFHVATAVVMGLNLFPWAFVAPYPAVLALAWTIHGAL